MKKDWLTSYTWQVIVETNRQLCSPKGALHSPSSDGYDPTRELWESRRSDVMDLAEATDLCRRCHQLAPFCNYNGNTFVAIVRQIITSLSLPPDQAAVVRSLAGHIVAGTADAEEESAFHQILQQFSDFEIDRNPPLS
jgi:hypothetical protein